MIPSLVIASISLNVTRILWGVVYESFGAQDTFDVPDTFGVQDTKAPEDTFGTEDIVGTEKNWDALIKDNKFVLAEFYAP